MVAAVIRRGRQVLMYRRREEGLMQDLWELPGGVCEPGEELRSAMVRETRARYGLDVEPGGQIARVRHTIMDRRITLHAFEARLRGKLGRKSELRSWVTPEAVSAYPASSMTLKVFKELDES
jgi:8-oxo-dGTP diphosphatase